MSEALRRRLFSPEDLLHDPVTLAVVAVFVSILILSGVTTLVLG